MPNSNDDQHSGVLPGSPPFRWRTLLPSPGNVVFTLLVASLLVVGQTAGAFSSLPESTAASTSIIPYQGRLADAGGNALNGSFAMTFKLYNVANAGSALWTENWSAGNSVTVTAGLFNILLGSLTPIPASVYAANNSLWLGIRVGVDAEMTPRVQLGSSPYSTYALTVADGSISTDKIADGAVDQSKAPILLAAQHLDERIEHGSASWSGVWSQNGAAGTWYRQISVIFTVPFSNTPEVFITHSSGDPEAWATVGGVSGVGFTAVNVAVTQIPNTNADSFSWIAIGQ